MTVSIPDRFALRLQHEATQSGLSIEDYLVSLLEPKSSEAVAQEGPPSISYEEWRERLLEFRRTRRHDLPILSEEEISRATIYEGR